MISIITALFDGNEAKNPPPVYSRKYYSEEWGDKLYRSIKRNYSDEFRFICLCDKGYEFVEPIESIRFLDPSSGWTGILDALRPECGKRRFVIALDTVITGNLDEILSFEGECALHSDPYNPSQLNNGVAFFNEEISAELWNEWNTRKDYWTEEIRYLGNCPSEMLFLRKNLNGRAERLDELHPGKILSWKAEIEPQGIDPESCSIVYFHGRPKQSDLQDRDWIKRHWI